MTPIRFFGLVAAAAAFGIVALSGPAPADAYKKTGYKWPTKTITFHNSIMAEDAAVKDAVRVWNTSGAAVRFKRTSRKRAKVRIKYLKQDACLGLTRLRGRGKFATSATVYLPRPSAATALCTDRLTQTFIAAHELGHVLGLDHDERHCATMNSHGNRRGGSVCDAAGDTPPWTWRCRILEYDDVRGAVKLYGGKARMSKFATPPLCPIYPDPPAPTGLTAEPTGPGQITARFVRPADSAIPPYLLPEARANAPSYAIAAQAGTVCPDLAAAQRWAWSAPVNATQSDPVSGLQAGPNCVAVWAVDVMGRPSAPVTTSVTVL
ncbi:MAG TPA: matrixin family metalloprotease [Baekduia sp.]|nr:matrixin family metalloprotease [Baekduia sp.]